MSASQESSRNDDIQGYRMEKRRKLQMLERQFNQRTHDLRDPTLNALEDYQTKLDELNREYRDQTGVMEDEVDTRQFEKTAEAASFHARLFQGETVNLNNFITQLRNRFVDEKTDTFDWSALGYESAGLWRRVPRCTILPADFLRRNPAIKRERTTPRTNLNTTIGDVDNTISHDNKQTHTHTQSGEYKYYATIVKKIQKIQGRSCVEMDDGTTQYGTPLVPTVFDPRSFSATIERLFYLSFSVKKNMAAIFLNKDKELHVGVNPKGTNPLQPLTMAKDDESFDCATNQFVFSLDQSMYRELLELYDLNDCEPKFRL